MAALASRNPFLTLEGQYFDGRDSSPHLSHHSTRQIYAGWDSPPVGFFSHPDDNAEKGSLPVLWLLPGILLIILFLSHSVRNISSNYFFIVLSSTD